MQYSRKKQGSFKKTHAASVHEGSMPFKYEVCDYRSSGKSDLKNEYWGCVLSYLQLLTHNVYKNTKLNKLSWSQKGHLGLKGHLPGHKGPPDWA